MRHRQWLTLYLLTAAAFFLAAVEVEAQATVPAEAPAAAETRHVRVAERRKGLGILCHRGASEFAHENTLEAYRATFELGGDGNEIDIRRTKDGVLVCFHDDMLDQILVAYGDVADHTWEELQGFRFRHAGRFGSQCRIPTLVEVLELHRKYGGLLHLDIKRPRLDHEIADLLTRMDMWDHVVHCNKENGGILFNDSRMRLRLYKSGLYADRGEVFPEAIAATLNKPGDDVICDDPRGVAIALGRKLEPLSSSPAAPQRNQKAGAPLRPGREAELITILSSAEDWDHVAESADDRAKSAQKIVARAQAADELLALRVSSDEAFAALEERVRNRSLHHDWMYHGLDGACALRTLIMLRGPTAVETARLAIWRDDPALERVADPKWMNPRTWTDFRLKTVAWPVLENLPGPDTEKLCREYLALSDDEARRLGPTQFEEAAKTLLAASLKTETALELMQHRLQIVRGRAIFVCLNRADEAWASAALEKGAPYALPYRVEIAPTLPSANRSLQ